MVCTLLRRRQLPALSVLRFQVTGARGGIGRALCTHLRDCNARVVAVDVKESARACESLRKSSYYFSKQVITENTFILAIDFWLLAELFPPSI